MKLKLPFKIPQFPHITRKITAPFSDKHLNLVLFGLAIITIILNLVYDNLPKTNNVYILKQKIMNDPFNSSYHEKLAQYYLNVNKYEAEKEFNLASEFYLTLTSQTSNRLLGSSSPPLTTWNNLIATTDKIKKEIVIWEEISKQHQDYEYSYLKLATLYMQIDEREKSREMLRALFKLNSTEKTALNLYMKLN